MKRGAGSYNERGAAQRPIVRVKEPRTHIAHEHGRNPLVCLSMFSNYMKAAKVSKGAVLHFASFLL
jgi:hypothetical protein